jgi:protein gp37
MAEQTGIETGATQTTRRTLKRRAANKIEWTGKTWNIVGGCKPTSPGCANCYSEPMTARCASMGNDDYAGLTRKGVGRKLHVFTGEFRLFRDKLNIPLKRKTPTTWFVNSMSDIFGEGVPDGFILDAFRVVANCPQHTFQFLTKRAERMVQWFTKWTDVEQDGDPVMVRGPAAVRAAHTSGRARLFADMIEGWGEPPAGAAYPTYDWMEGMRWWPDVFANAWLGVSVEDKKHGVPRIDHLRKVPAKVRFLSIEPLLEDLGEIDLTGIHLVIIGGESGRGARVCKAKWIRNVIRQARAQGVRVFVKQGGAKFSDEENGIAGRSLKLPKEAAKLLKQRLKHAKGGDLAELPEDLRIREMPPTLFGMVP